MELNKVGVTYGQFDGGRLHKILGKFLRTSLTKVIMGDEDVRTIPVHTNGDPPGYTSTHTGLITSRIAQPRRFLQIRCPHGCTSPQYHCFQQPVSTPLPIHFHPRSRECDSSHVCSTYYRCSATRAHLSWYILPRIPTLALPQHPIV